jgi:hypothetical protein
MQKSLHRLRALDKTMMTALEEEQGRARNTVHGAHMLLTMGGV